MGEISNSMARLVGGKRGWGEGQSWGPVRPGFKGQFHCLLCERKFCYLKMGVILIAISIKLL